MRLLIATRNSGKLAEIRDILSPFAVQLTDLDAVGVTGEVPETGQTFEQNAILKAVGYREMSGIATLADDSGLVVEALEGRPGVRSARYAGDAATDSENLALLLKEMKDLPADRRMAHFECVVAIAMEGAEVVTFTGRVEGHIAIAPEGDGGFGYDPVFVPCQSGTALHGRTMAQLSSSEKAAISHRGMAVRRAAEWLRRQADGEI